MLRMLLLIPPTTQYQQSVNDCWSCILGDQMAMQQRWPVIELSALRMGINDSDSIATTSSICAPMEYQQFSWRLCKRHSNQLHCAVSKLSHYQSVFSICLCIPLHKFVCNAWYVRHLLCLYLSNWYLETSLVLYDSYTFDSLVIQITEISHFYCEVEFTILTYLVAVGHDIC
jgi:hypothetical protein